MNGTERTAFVDGMTDHELAFAVSVLKYLHPDAFDDVAARIARQRAAAAGESPAAEGSAA